MLKITELEQVLAQEQQYVSFSRTKLPNSFCFQKIELQRTIKDLQNELFKSRSIAKDSLEKSEEFERHLHETDKHFTHEPTEPTRREFNNLRIELIAKSDQNTTLQHAIEDEKLKRQLFSCLSKKSFCFFRIQTKT